MSNFVSPYAYRTDATPAYNQVRLLLLKESSLNVENRTVEGWASTPDVDSYDEVILPSAYAKSLPNFMKNPVHYWNHNWWDIPIGSVREARIEPAGLWVQNHFNTTDLAAQVWLAVREESVRSMSVGFRGYYSPEYGYWDDDNDVFVWTNLDLMEISTVGMPANKFAQYQLSRALGLPMLKICRSIDLPIAKTDDDFTWDPHGATKRIAKWGENAGPDRTEGLFLFSRELPLVDVLDEKPHIVWDGLACAMAHLLGARGGVEMPSGAKRTAFKSLIHLYSRVGKEGPTWTGDWPASFNDVTFRSNEPEILEKTVALDNARACKRAAESLQNIVRHWKSEGRGPSTELTQLATSSIEALRTFATSDDRSSEDDPKTVEQSFRLTL